jgi:site-specific DNA-cytosine methylase
MKHMLDLFSGLGGASESMLKNGWEVLRIENNPELSLVENTCIMGVAELRDSILEHSVRGMAPTSPDLIWASPPCNEFSLGYAAPGPTAQRAGLDFQPSLELVKIAKEIIDLCQPKYWVIENVRGAIKHLTPILGEPTLIIDSIVLWGRFPCWGMPPHYQHIKDDAWSSTPLRANIRAKIPFAVSDACRLSIENTRTLDNWI